MNIITTVTIILNIIAILVLCVGLFHKFNTPKSKAIYGYAIAGGMIPYMLALSIYVIADIIKLHFWSVLLILCVISPFIIGKLVKFETLKKYTFIQILCFCASLMVLCLK